MPGAIYLDTSAARNAGWPKESEPLSMLGQLSSAFNYGIYIPHVVMVELEQGWIRGFEEKTKNVWSFLRYADSFGVGAPLRAAMENLDAQAVYARESSLVLAAMHADLIDTTMKPVEDFAVMASKRIPPFTTGDEGFRDAVIFESMMDHARTAGMSECYIVAHDKSFLHMANLLDGSGLKVAVHETVKSMNDVLMGKFSEALQSIVERDRKRAMDALLRERHKLEEFIQENVRFYETDITEGLLWCCSVRTINNISVGSIKEVRPSVTYPFPKEDTNVLLSCELELIVEASCENYTDEAPRLLRMGEVQDPNLQLELPVRQAFIPTLKKIADLDASAKRGADGMYSEISFKEIRIRRNRGVLSSYLSLPMPQ